MKQSTANQKPAFLDYIYELNQGIKCSEALELSLKNINAIDIAPLKRIGLKTYAKDKWTIPTIIQHLIDWERIWNYRAIVFARKEGTIPSGQDQEIMAKHSNADKIPIEQLIHELKILRQSTILMFQSFDKKTLDTNCKFFEYEMPLYAIGLTISAHQIHHLKVIQEKYIPLDDG